MEKIFALALALILIAGCAPDTKTLQQSQGGKITGGVQIAKLSWGKLNYEPEVIRFRANSASRIVADTDRLQGCFRSLVIPELGLQKTFSENDNSLDFTP